MFYRPLSTALFLPRPPANWLLRRQTALCQRKDQITFKKCGGYLRLTAGTCLGTVDPEGQNSRNWESEQTSRALPASCYFQLFDLCVLLTVAALISRPCDKQHNEKCRRRQTCKIWNLDDRLQNDWSTQVNLCTVTSRQRRPLQALSIALPRFFVFFRQGSANRFFKSPAPRDKHTKK